MFSTGDNSIVRLWVYDDESATAVLGHCNKQSDSNLP